VPKLVRAREENREDNAKICGPRFRCRKTVSINIINISFRTIH